MSPASAQIKLDQGWLNFALTSLSKHLKTPELDWYSEFTDAQLALLAAICTDTDRAVVYQFVQSQAAAALQKHAQELQAEHERALVSSAAMLLGLELGVGLGDEQCDGCDPMVGAEGGWLWPEAALSINGT